MATFFGEVVPVYSRAVQEEEEDEDEDEYLEEEDEEDREIKRELQEKRNVVVSWSPVTLSHIDSSPDKKISCSHFIAAVGDNPAAFVSSYILSSGDWEEVGSIRCWNERCRVSSSTRSVLPHAPSCCTFYRSTAKQALVCLCTCYVAEDQMFQWCEKVFGFLHKSRLKVTVLSTCPVSNYKTTQSTFDLPVPFLKALKTSTYVDKMACGHLEQPNVVDGLPAAVLMHCQEFAIPGVLYHCYTDMAKLDSVTVEAFCPVLSCPDMSHLAADAAQVKEVLKKVVKEVELQSNLYI
uniref:Proteasome assembly chaperone 1 n=1 Tax=Leptobrachium leishanense TaxID=445787 RepID=A0A8C5M7Z5_9ANUR